MKIVRLKKKEVDVEKNRMKMLNMANVNRNNLIIILSLHVTCN